MHLRAAGDVWSDGSGDLRACFSPHVFPQHLSGGEHAHIILSYPDLEERF